MCNDIVEREGAIRVLGSGVGAELSRRIRVPVGDIVAPIPQAHLPRGDSGNVAAIPIPTIASTLKTADFVMDLDSQPQEQGQANVAPTVEVAPIESIAGANLPQRKSHQSNLQYRKACNKAASRKRQAEEVREGFADDQEGFNAAEKARKKKQATSRAKNRKDQRRKQQR